MGFNWGPENVDRLKELAGQSLSATRIAAEFGVTKNTIIGKARRLGVELQYVIPRRPGSVVVTRARNNPFRGSSNKSQPLPVFEPDPDSRNLTVLQLKGNDCRFPTSEDHPMLFCGSPKAAGSSYCPHHHGVCHVDPRAR